MKKLEELQRKKIQQLKMKSLLLKKHDTEDDFDEDLELSTEQDIVQVKTETTIITTLLSSVGTYILLSIAAFLALYITIDKYELQTKKIRKIKKE